MPSALKEIYVGKSGSDSGTGTLSDPYASVARACSAATPGTHIVLRAGVYHEGEISLETSGTPDAPVVLRSAPGETAILDGSDPALLNAEWSELSPQVYQHSSRHDVRNVSLKRLVDGKMLRAYRMATAEEVVQASSVFADKSHTFTELSIQAAYASDGSVITIRIPAGSSIKDYAVYVSRSNHALRIDRKNHIQIHGLTFAHYGAGDYSRAIILNDSSDVVVQNCRFHYNNTGINLKRDCSRIVIQDNVAIDDTADWHFGYTKSAGVLYHGEIETGWSRSNGPFSGRGVVIRRNAVRGLFDGFGIAPVPYTGTRTAEIDFYHNTIQHVADDFLEIDGYARNYRVFRNKMHESLSGISLAQSLDGPVWIVRNLILDCGNCKGTELEGYQGYPFKTNGGYGADIGAGSLFLYHNTASSRNPASNAMLFKQAKWKQMTLRNNIWVGEQHGFMSWSKTVSPLDWDYDNLYTHHGILMQFGNRGEARHNIYYRSLEDVISGTGWLSHGISANPLFSNPSTVTFAFPNQAHAGTEEFGCRESMTDLMGQHLT